VKIDDTRAPTIDLPASSSIVKATGANGAVYNFSASANDLVEGILGVSCSPRSGAIFPLGRTTVNCSASDSRGNSDTGSFIVDVRDLTDPKLELPSNGTSEATGPNGATVTYRASARDDVDGVLSASCNPESGSTLKLGKTTVTCSATDNAGNSASGSFVVSVVDTKAPVLNLPDSFTVKATSGSGAIVSFQASASDVVDGAITASCSPRSGSVFQSGVTIVTCSATDNAGNSASDSFKVLVADSTPPDLDIPSDFSLEATGPNGAVASFSVSANDAVDGELTAVCSPRSGSSLDLGVNKVSCSATDKSGNKTEKFFNISIVDTRAPNLSLPGNITLVANGNGVARLSFTASAKDLVDGEVAVNCDPDAGTSLRPGVYTVSCSAKDRSGNSSSDSFGVTVVPAPTPTPVPPSPTPTPVPPTPTPVPPTPTPSSVPPSNTATPPPSTNNENGNGESNQNSGEGGDGTTEDSTSTSGNNP
jgi:hypothetical protein